MQSNAAPVKPGTALSPSAYYDMDGFNNIDCLKLKRINQLIILNECTKIYTPKTLKGIDMGIGIAYNNQAV